MTDRRKQLLRAYKERKTAPGAFAVRCAAAGETFVGVAPDLTNRENGVWFSLRLGSHPNRQLQDLWAREGADAFTFEVLEVLEADEPLEPYVLAAQLKDLEAAWLERLGGRKLVG